MSVSFKTGKNMTALAFVFLVYLTIAMTRVMAQNGFTDGPFLNIPTVNVTSKKKMYQNNWCSRRDAFLNGSISIDNALMGSTVYLAFNPKLLGGWNIAAGDSGLWYQVKVDPKLGPVSGFMPEFWAALSTRMGFKVQWVYVPYKGSTAFATYVKYMNSITDGWGAGTITDLGSRRAIGIDFSDNTQVGTFALFGPTTTTTPPKLWNFLLPFSPILWIALLCVLIFNGGVLQWFNPPESDDTFIFSIIRSLNSFSGDKVDVS